MTAMVGSVHCDQGLLHHRPIGNSNISNQRSQNQPPPAQLPIHAEQASLGLNPSAPTSRAVSFASSFRQEPTVNFANKKHIIMRLN